MLALLSAPLRIWPPVAADLAQCSHTAVSR